LRWLSCTWNSPRLLAMASISSMKMIDGQVLSRALEELVDFALRLGS
jgi:hypothetical protein